MQERFLQTCGQIKEEVKNKIITPLERKIGEAVRAIQKTSSDAFSLAKTHFSPLGKEISKKTTWVASHALEALAKLEEKRKLVDRKVSEAFRKSIKEIQSAPKKMIRSLKVMHFETHCDNQILRTNKEIKKIDKELQSARKIVLVQYHKINRAVQETQKVPLDKTALESLKRYIEDPSAENLYQIGDAIRRQIDTKPEDKRFSASNKFYAGLKDKGLDLKKVAELDALLRKKKACLKTREEWRSKKKEGLRTSYVLTV